MRILLIDIDSLRPDHLGCYGYTRSTSPTIDLLASQSVRFTRCFTSDSPCMPSRAGLITGRHGIRNGVVAHVMPGQQMRPNFDGRYFPDVPFTTNYLNHNGCYCVSFSSFASRHQAWWFAAAWREYHQVSLKNGLETYDEVNAAVLPWLRQRGREDNWLVHVNYWDVHEPYRLVDRKLGLSMAATGPGPEWPDDAAIARQQDMTGIRCATLIWDKVEERPWPTPDRIRNRADFDHLCAGYDAAIKNVDEAISEVVAELQRQDILDDTAIIVTADHGDAMGEHGIYADHAMAHPPCQRVPLIVRWPGLTDTLGVAGTVRHGLIYQFDVMATICELLGLSVPKGWDAQPFTAAIRGEEFMGRGELVCGQGIYMFSRALYTKDNWCYVRLLHPGIFSFPGLYGRDQLELLHDLGADPHLTRNLIQEEPDRANEFRTRMDLWLNDKLIGNTDPLAAMLSRGPYEYYTQEKYLSGLIRAGQVEAALRLLE